MEKLKKMFAPELQETVVSIVMLKRPPSPPYLRGNIQWEKSEKKL